MKAILFSIISLFIANGASAQGYSYSTIKAKLINAGYTLCDEYSVTLRQGETGGLHRDFYRNSEYRIVAFSNDGDVKDIDLYLYDDEDGELYTKDNDNTSLCVIDFAPTFKSRSFKITVKNYTSSTPSYESPCYILVGCK